jgi:hypothetical protein
MPPHEAVFAHHQVAGLVANHARAAIEADPDGRRVATGRYDPVVFELLAGFPAKDEIYAGVNIPITQLRVMSSAAHPLRGVVAKEVIGAYGKRVETLDLGAATPARKLHRYAGSPSILGAESDGHPIVEEKCGAILNAESESYAPVELAAIFLEGQRIENVRASSGLMPFGGKGLGGRRERTGDQHEYGGTWHGVHRTPSRRPTASVDKRTRHSVIGKVCPYLAEMSRTSWKMPWRDAGRGAAMGYDFIGPCVVVRLAYAGARPRVLTRAKPSRRCAITEE